MVGNNSVWNHRWLTISHQGVASDNKTPDDVNTTSVVIEGKAPTAAWTAEVIEQEIKYTQAAISQIQKNVSPWNYLEGLLNLPNCGSEQREILKNFALGCVSASPSSDGNNIGPLSLLIELTARFTTESTAVAEAVEYCNVLADIEDTVRKPFWLFRKQQLLDISNSGS